MRWWRTNSFGGGEKDGECSGDPFLGPKGLQGYGWGSVCGVWEREGGERKGRERRRGEKERSIYSSSTPPSPQLRPPIRPSGSPSGDTSGHHTPHYTLPSSYPTYPTQAQKWGIPTSSPPGEREEKEGEKGVLATYNPQFFSGGEPPDPPSLNERSKEKTRKTRARVMFAGRTKSIDLLKTSSMVVSVSL